LNSQRRGQAASLLRHSGRCPPGRLNGRPPKVGAYSRKLYQAELPPDKKIKDLKGNICFSPAEEKAAKPKRPTGKTVKN